MIQNTEAPRGLAGALREDSAEGGTSAPILTQVPDELEASDVLAAYWAEAKCYFLADDFPQYATREWRELPFEDPRKFAGLMRFAELWRAYGADISGELDEATRPRPPIYQRPTIAELDQRHDDMLARNRRGRGKEAA